MTGRTISQSGQNSRFSQARLDNCREGRPARASICQWRRLSEPNARPLAGILSPSLSGKCRLRKLTRSRTKIVNPLDNSPRLSPEQQAPLVAQLQKAEFRERDLPSDMLGAGLWMAYAVLAMVWLRMVAKRRTLRWLFAVRRRVVAPMVARYAVWGVERVKEQRPGAPLFTEPATVQI
jgi:hypothetical protein